MNDVWYISQLELAGRILLALCCGGVIGLEREWTKHAAGFRTHILVCVGSSIVMLLSIYGFSEFIHESNVRMDPSRLAAQVVSGIGFLGAGAIMRNGRLITGLTTAASIWTVAAIGLCIGAGFYFVAIVSTVLVLISLFVFYKWEKKFLVKDVTQRVNIYTLQHSDVLQEITKMFRENDCSVKKMELKQLATGGDQQHTVQMSFWLVAPKIEFIYEAIAMIHKRDEILSVDVGNNMAA